MKLVGRTINSLTILENLGTRPEKSGHYVRWVLCGCVCSNKKEVRLTSLKRGEPKSCGCLNKSNLSTKQIKQNHVTSTNKFRKTHISLYKKYSEKYRTSFSSRFSILKNISKRRGVLTTITKEQHKDLLTLPCYYCGNTLFGETGAGLDRKDNSKYYTLNNVLPCCCSCNRIRNIYLTVDEMKFVIEQLKLYRKRLEGV